MNRSLRPRSRYAALLALAALPLALTACLGSSRGSPTARSADNLVIRDIDPLYRGLIGSETVVRGQTLRLITGVGLVVGLSGTGSADVPAGIRIQLEERMTRLGVGRAGGGPLSNITPDQLIDSPDTAVVLVQAVISPSMPKDTPFDVRVSSWPGSATTSLEGGRLYTTELRMGRRGPDEPDVPAVAEARGELFINPFTEDDRLTPQTDARILSGGTIVKRRPIQLVLDNPSHARAREIVTAINSRFPRDGRYNTAVGRNDEIVELNVPNAFRDDVDEFVRLVRFLRVDRSNRIEWARRYADAMVERPAAAEDLSWAMRSLGKATLPFLRPLYDHPDVTPRNAAIQAGAFLGDPTVRPHIERIVESGPPAFRTNAIALLADLDTDPRVNSFLREKLSDPDPAIRVAAYEAMLERDDPLILKPDVGDAFRLHVVPSSTPTVYVTQQNEPKIVLFGRDLAVEDEAFAAAWEGDFLLRAAPSSPRVEMLYEQPDINRLVRVETDRGLVRVVRALARRPTPESFELGFDMTYSRAVRVLAEMIDSGAVNAAFFPEEDRLRLALLRARNQTIDERPGLIGETPEDRAALNQPPSDAELAAEAEAARERESRSLRDTIVEFPNPNENANNDGDGND